MSRHRLTLIALAAAVMALAGLSLGGVAAGQNGGRPLDAILIGATEVPGPGDADATGTAQLRLNSGQRRICYELTWRDVDGTVFAAHIHKAPAGQSGGVFQDLFVGRSFSGTGSDSNCVTATRAQIKEIRKNPSGFYVNVHSRPSFPGGAIRGQLTK